MSSGYPPPPKPVSTLQRVAPFTRRRVPHFALMGRTCTRVGKVVLPVQERILARRHMGNHDRVADHRRHILMDVPHWEGKEVSCLYHPLLPGSQYRHCSLSGHQARSLRGLLRIRLLRKASRQYRLTSDGQRRVLNFNFDFNFYSISPIRYSRKKNRLQWKSNDCIC